MNKDIKKTQISLPKGGGAIRGIGETFQSKEFTGTAGLTIPVPTSTCRGSEPKLSIDYSSGSGNEIFGIGFGLSIPNISRKFSTGIPKYDDSDVFIISNAEDLVPTNGSKSEKTINNVIYTVVTYRPRVEGLFAKIEHWTDNSGNSYWRVVSKDNITSIFGKNSDSRISDPANPMHVFQWLLTETFDAKGNHVFYEYKAEDGYGTASVTYEKNRVQTADKYIKRICYGNTQPFAEGADNGNDWLFEVLFDYGEYNFNPANPTTSESQNWLNRQDPFSTYHAGFEIRTQRLCHNILMFHNFKELDDKKPVLIHATHFNYQQSPVMTMLQSVEAIGYRIENGAYQTKPLPPLTFEYTNFQPQNQTFKQLTKENGQPLPGLNLPPDYQLIDLYGEGIPGILYSDGTSTFYSEPTGKDDEDMGMRYNQPQVPLSMPIDSSRERINSLLMDMTGNGQLDLLVSSSAGNGYYEVNSDHSWSNFCTFASFPTDFHNPDNFMADVTGSGLLDLLLIKNDCVCTYPSLGKDGFGPPIISRLDEGISLPIPGAATEVVRFADMFGTGTQHFVRITSGKVECWPNLGYGRFGVPVTLDNAPVFVEELDASRLFLVDIDGSGTMDIIYAYPDRLEVFFNQSGNSFSAPLKISLPGIWDRMNQIDFADIYGNGTTCVIFSEKHPLPNHWLCDFNQQQKPYLLNVIDNNLGAKSTITYASSTEFCLSDKEKGNRWITNLYFPVQVVAKTESYDAISGSKLVSTYTYHHGFYDGIEQKFRGFGMVERLDAETLTVNSQPTDVPPVLTRTWYHTGAWLKEESLSNRYRKEYFKGDIKAYQLPESIFDTADNPLDEEADREACQALKGTVLREEVYAVDLSSLQENPYTVTETNYTVKQLQPKGQNRNGVYFVHPRETIAYHYERNPNDPRIQHDFVLETTLFGNVTKSCSIYYGRRTTTDPNVTVYPEQMQLRATIQLAEFIEVTDAFRLIDIPCEQKAFEINGLDLKGQSYFSFDEILKQVNHSLSERIAYAVPFTDNTLQSRLFSWTQVYYWNDTQNRMLDLGQITQQALLHHQQKTVFSMDWLQQVYGNKLDDKILENEGGYIEENGYWWNKGLVQYYYEAEKFYLPYLTKNDFAEQANQADGLKVKTVITYDAYNLLPVMTEAYLSDSEKNATTAMNDYHTLSPWQLTDENGIIHQVLFDPLGMVIATSVFKEAAATSPRQGDGNLEDFAIDQQGVTFDDVLIHPENYLNHASSFFYYDLSAWQNNKQPASYIHLARHTHVSELQQGQASLIQISIGFSDGFGREIESKTAVEPDDDAKDVNRWLVSGRTVYNNKGKPAEQYLPYFSNTPYYETQAEMMVEKLPPPTVIHYDPLLREIRYDTPKGFFSMVEFSPWESKHYDVNDTVKDSAYYRQFMSNYPAHPTDEQKNEKDALDKAAVFHNTPSISVLDSSGNAFLNIENNQGTQNRLTSYHNYDIQGRLIESIDPRLYASNITQGTTYYNFKYQYPMGADGNHPASTDSADAGLNLSLDNIFGSFLWNLSPRNFEQTIFYDCLQRKTKIRVKGFKDDGTLVTDNIVETYIYGESQPSPEVNNLRGKLYRHQDQSGQILHSKYNIQGQMIETARQFASGYKDSINWGNAVDLETDTFTTLYSFNALQQLISETTPDGSVTTRIYNQGGLLDQVKVTFKDNTSQDIVHHVSYNANRQRTQIVYANGITTKYSYEDTTLNLVKLYSIRSDKTVMQDITYTYDPAGNITRTYDDTYKTVFNNNQIVEPQSDYTYDALYRLIKASGRQHPGINAGTYRNHEKDGDFKQSKYFPINDGQTLENYTETYSYDEAGNLIQTRHNATNSWTRSQEIMPDSNRLKTIVSGNDSQNIAYDKSGNMKQFNINSTVDLTWSCCENLVKVGIISRPDELDDCDYYTYDRNEMRTRKVSERLANGTLVQREEKKYLGNYEVKSIKNGETTVLIRNTLRVMDDKTCVAIIHYWEKDDLKREVDTPGSRKLRYQLDNNLGSVALELDKDAQIISCEEYFPYGGTALIAGANQTEVKLKEYRYSGKERDDSTGLYYYGARYYAPWLGRWISPDPAGTVDGLNLYTFVGGNPVSHVDEDGMVEKKKFTIDRSKTKAAQAARAAPAASEPRQATTAAHEAPRFAASAPPPPLSAAAANTSSKPNPWAAVQKFGSTSTTTTTTTSTTSDFPSLSESRTMLARPSAPVSRQSFIDLYHGTTARRAEAFRTRGEVHYSTHTDFGKGFYTTNERAQADEWSQKRAVQLSDQPAVLHFKVPTAFIDELKREGITYRGGTELMEFIMKNREEKYAEHSYKLVEGPMLLNPGESAPEFGGHQMSFHTPEVIGRLRGFLQ